MSTARLVALAACCAALLCATPDVHAQSRPGTTGLGGQIGDPSGLSVKLYTRSTFAYDFLAAWDLDDFFFLNVHGTYERPLGTSPLGFFYGPGVLIGFRDDDEGPPPGRDDDEDDIALGLSGTFGLNVFIEQFEIYGRITPRLLLVPSTDGDIGGGIGVRYYF